MSIKFKLIIPTLLGFLIVLGFIELFWQPKQLEIAKVKYEENIKELLSLAEVSITPHILEKDLGSLYANMESLDKKYAGRWHNINFYDKDNKKVYPIFNGDLDASVLSNELIEISYDIKISGDVVGRIVFEAD